MKTVFSSHNEVCHAWASQQVPHGKGSNILFEGPSIYSYGRHFEMARFIRPNLVFHTTRTYSSSTSKHLSRTRSAVSHLPSFTVPSFTYHPDNLRYFFQQARETMVKAQRAKSHKEWLTNQAQNYVRTALNYVDTLDLTDLPEDIIKDLTSARANTFFDPAHIDALMTEAKEAQRIERARNKEQREARAQREREEVQKELADLEQWKAGTFQGWRNFHITALRVKDTEVETSRGAKVPVIEARKLYRALKAGVNVIGQRIGLFTVNKLTDTELIVGCHTIPLTEIERIAPQVMEG